MRRRNQITVILAALSIAGATTAAAPAVGRADICANVGRHISVGGCVNLRDGLGRYAPPPEYHAPLPEDYPRLPPPP